MELFKTVLQGFLEKGSCTILAISGETYIEVGTDVRQVTFEIALTCGFEIILPLVK